MDQHTSVNPPLTPAEQFGFSASLAILGCTLAVCGLSIANSLNASDFLVATLLLASASLSTMESYRIAPHGRWLIPIIANGFVFILVGLLATALAVAAFR